MTQLSNIRRRLYFSSFLVLLGLSLFSEELMAQPLFENPRKFQFQLSYGYSFKSVKLLGKTPDAVTGVINLGMSTPLKTFETGGILFYHAAVLPFIKYSYPRRDYDGAMGRVNGFGATPIGFSYRKPWGKSLSFMAETAGGFVLVEHRFPTDKGRKLNFTFEISPQLVLRTGKNLAFAAGYKFHHISNANTGRQNPGIDSNFLFFSLIVN